MTDHRRHRSTRSLRITKYLSAPRFTPPGQQILGVVMPWKQQPKGGSPVDRVVGVPARLRLRQPRRTAVTDSLANRGGR